MSFHVTGAAEGDEVRSLTGAAVSQRQDVMHFLGGLDDTVLQALLTQRISFDLSVADALPRSAVGVLIVGALILVIKPFRLHLVLRAVLFTRGSKTGAAGVAAGPFGTGGHTPHLLSGQRKDRPGLLPSGLVHSFSLIIL